MTVVEQIGKRIEMRYHNPEVRRGGVYLVNEDVGPLCLGITAMLNDRGIPAFLAWEDGLSKSGGSSADVTHEMMTIGLERSSRLRGGGVLLVELRRQDFDMSSKARLEGLAMVETDRVPKRMVAWVTESGWIAGVLAQYIEDMRGKN